MRRYLLGLCAVVLGFMAWKYQEPIAAFARGFLSVFVG